MQELQENKITQSFVLNNFYYNQDSGELYNKNRKYSKIKKVNTLSTKGYLRVTINYKQYFVHIIIWLYVYGYLPSTHIDHINGNKTDNRLSNLREVTNKQNHRNMALFSNSKTLTCGVSFVKRINKYRAYITINGKQKHLGYFESLKDAEIERLKFNKKFNFSERHGT